MLHFTGIYVVQWVPVSSLFLPLTDRNGGGSTFSGHLAHELLWFGQRNCGDVSNEEYSIELHENNNTWIP